MQSHISLREFGRQVGVTGEYVRRAIAEGKIPPDCVGSVTMSSGQVRPCIIDPVKAADAWGRSRDTLMVRDKQQLSEGAKSGWESRRANANKPNAKSKPVPRVPKSVTSSTLLDQVAALAEDGDETSVAAYKRREAAARARIRELELEEMEGRLVDAGAVKAGFVSILAAGKSKLLGVPSKARGRRPSLTIEDVELLEDMIGEVLQDMATSVDAVKFSASDTGTESGS